LTQDAQINSSYPQLLKKRSAGKAGSWKKGVLSSRAARIRLSKEKFLTLHARDPGKADKTKLEWPCRHR